MPSGKFSYNYILSYCLTIQVRVGDARKHLAALKVECANAPANKKKRWDYDSDSDYSD